MVPPANAGAAVTAYTEAEYAAWYQQHQQLYAGWGASWGAYSAAPEMLPGPPGAKRQRLAEPPAPRAPSPEPSQQALAELRAALRKLRAHIGKPAKFAKASALLRKVLDDGTVTHHAATEAFQVRDHFSTLRKLEKPYQSC